MSREDDRCGDSACGMSRAWHKGEHKFVDPTRAEAPQGETAGIVMKQVSWGGRYATYADAKTTTQGDQMDPKEQNVPMCDPSNVPPTAPTLEGTCNRWRAELLDTEHYVRALVSQKKVTGEAAAQAMLAVRHLEDARMRLGKVIQHTAGGGISCWDSERKAGDDGR
jgi:hypothetical protein